MKWDRNGILMERGKYNQWFIWDLVVFTILESYMKAFRPSLLYPSIFHILEKQERWTTLEITMLLDMYKHHQTIPRYIYILYMYIYIHIHQRSTISIVRQKKHDCYICAAASKVIQDQKLWAVCEADRLSTMLECVKSTDLQIKTYVGPLLDVARRRPLGVLPDTLTNQTWRWNTEYLE